MFDRNPMVSYKLYTYSLPEGVKGIAPPDSPRQTSVVLYSKGARKRTEDGRMEWSYESSNEVDFPAPSPSDNQNTAIASFEKTIADKGWKIAHEGRKACR